MLAAQHVNVGKHRRGDRTETCDQESQENEIEKTTKNQLLGLKERNWAVELGKGDEGCLHDHPD